MSHTQVGKLNASKILDCLTLRTHDGNDGDVGWGGEVAQLVRARGRWPCGQGYES